MRMTSILICRPIIIVEIAKISAGGEAHHATFTIKQANGHDGSKMIVFQILVHFYSSMYVLHFAEKSLQCLHCTHIVMYL